MAWRIRQGIASLKNGIKAVPAKLVSTASSNERDHRIANPGSRYEAGIRCRPVYTLKKAALSRMDSAMEATCPDVAVICSAADTTL